jgi:hypothetical protein
MSKEKTKQPEEFDAAATAALVEEAPAELVDPGYGDDRHLPAVRGPVDLDAPANVDVSGVPPPRLQLTHGVGSLAENFNPGDLVLDKEHLVCPKGGKIEMILLRIDQFYREILSREGWESGQFPQNFEGGTLEECKKAAEKAGLRVEWEGETGPEAGPAMDAIVLLRKPKDLACPLFAIKLDDGEPWAIAMLSADKRVYKTLMRDMGNTIRAKLSAGLYKGRWELWTEIAGSPKSKNKTQVIRTKYIGETTPDQCASIRNSLG